jgi:hypothetical protein
MARNCKTMIKVTLTNTLAYYSAMSFPDSKCFVEEKKVVPPTQWRLPSQKKPKFANKKKFFFHFFWSFTIILFHKKVLPKFKNIISAPALLAVTT